MTTVYDLEQQIMECWRVTDDMKILTEEVMEGDFNKDQICNVLIGLEQLYNVKFNKLFRTYEKHLEDYYNLTKKIEKPV